MKKDAYFFPHFCNARHDRKLKRVQKELGIEGYGIFFMLLEVLREQTDFRYPMDDLDLLADEFGTSEQKIRAVVCNYGLFDMNEQETFISPKLLFYLQPYIEKTQRARDAANLRWHGIKNPDANAYANALPEHCNGNASAMQGEERRGEDKIEEHINNISPELEPEPTDSTLPDSTESDDTDKKQIIVSSYNPEIETFVRDYQDYVLKTFGKLSPKITRSLINKSCDVIDKLIRLDGFTFQEIMDTITWASSDDFWSRQILSIASLRNNGKNGQKKFVNIMASHKSSGKVGNNANKRLMANLEAGRRFLEDD